MSGTKWIFAVVMLVFTMSAWTQDRGGQRFSQQQSSILVTADGLTCNTLAGTGSFSAIAWSFGASQSGTVSNGAGSGAGKASLTGLSVTKRADSCSPALFGDVVSGRVLKSVTLVQQDRSRDDVVTVTLTNVAVSNYQLGGEQTEETPSEQVTFVFAKICVADTQTGTKFCWDAQQNRAF